MHLDDVKSVQLIVKNQRTNTERTKAIKRNTYEHVSTVE